MNTNGLVARIQGKPDRWKERWGQRLVAAVPMGWLLVFFLAPFLFVLKIAFSENRIGIPPYQPLLEWVDGAVLQLQLNLANFGFFLEDPLYAAAYLSSLKMAAVSTLICLLIGYPMAYGITKVNQPWRNVLLMLVILPFWTSFLIRSMPGSASSRTKGCSTTSSYGRASSTSRCRCCIPPSPSTSASSIRTCRS